MNRKKFDDLFKSAAELFKLLAHSDRLRILGIISEQELDVSHICQSIGISQSSASQHFKLFKIYHLVNERRSGKRVFYKLSSPLVKELILSAMEIHSRDLSKESKNASLYKEVKSLLKQKLQSNNKT